MSSSSRRASKDASSVTHRARHFDETTRTILSAIAIAMLIRMFAFEPFNIPSSSMVPNLLIGDFLFVSKYAYGYSSRSTVLGLLPFKGRLFAHQPERGDVVVFKWPKDNRTDYIKRVVGLPGDTVQMRHGLLYVNGVATERRKLAEPKAQRYLTAPSYSVDYLETFPDGHEHVIRKDEKRFLDDDGLSVDNELDNTNVFTVPPGHYFMMGDNRDNSQDSRTPHVGFVPEENLVGRAEFLFFSLDENARFWQFWKWPWAVRWSRMFSKIE